MKKLLILLFSILISFNSYGLFEKTVCVETDTQDRNGIIYLPNETKPFTGKNLCKYENGQYKSEGKFKDGIKDGKWTYWFKNGQIEFKGNVKKNIPDGLQTVFNKKGQLEAQAIFKNGVCISGVCDYFDKLKK